MDVYRLSNPFTPKSLASGEGDFFGRKHELRELQDNLKLGHIAIHGPVGIGKSSLLARISQIMQQGEHRSILIQGVCNLEIKSADHAAAMILGALPREVQAKHKIRLGLPFLGYEVETGGSPPPPPGESPMMALRRFVHESASAQLEYLIFAFDQAETCPTALTALVRTLVTSVELTGCHKLRVILCGVSPYFARVTDGDTGLRRVFTEARVLPLDEDEATELVDAKLRLVIQDARSKNLSVWINPKVSEGIVRLSGGHPHVIQLLGSHMIQHENSNPDDVLDAKDLVGAVQRICYEDRGDIYSKTIEALESAEMVRPLTSVLSLATHHYPTIIDRKDALRVVGPDMLEEFVKRDILTRDSGGKLRLVDEFLVLRMRLDHTLEPSTAPKPSPQDKELGRLLSGEWPYDDDDDDDE